MLRKRSVVLALMVVAGNVAGAVTDLQWLAGAWCGTNQGIVNEEVWLPPRAGSLVGMHRDSKDGRLRGFEYFRIVEDGDPLHLAQMLSSRYRRLLQTQEHMQNRLAASTDWKRIRLETGRIVSDHVRSNEQTA